MHRATIHQLQSHSCLKICWLMLRRYFTPIWIQSTQMHTEAATWSRARTRHLLQSCKNSDCLAKNFFLNWH